MEFCNTQRPHSALDGSTPAEAYERGMLLESQTKPPACPSLCRLNQNTKS